MDLQRLIDERAIVGVALTYCRALDTRDWELLRTIFVPDATARLGTSSQQEGVDAIIDRCRAALGALDLSHHLVGNHEVSVDGDVATHRCYLQAQHVRTAADGGSNFVVAGRYEDRLVRTDEGWKIAHRDLVTMWTEGNPAVVGRG